MKTNFDKTVNALCRLVDVKPIDWNALDHALSEIEDINIYDEDNDETLLSDFVRKILEDTVCPEKYEKIK